MKTKKSPPRESPQTVDPNLAKIIETWPTLATEIRAAVAAIVTASRSR